MSNEMKEWQAERKDSRSKFISAFVQDDATKELCKSSLHKYDEVVFRLAKRFATSPDQIDEFLEAGWSVAMKNIVFRSSLLPQEDQIEKWTFELWEQLNLHHHIIIEDILDWTKECGKLWAN
jgi:hypothetical protein